MAGTIPSEREIGDAFNREPEAESAPVNRADAITRKTGVIDSRLEQLVERHRDVSGGESHAQAADRLMRERPSIYRNFKAAKAAELRKNGIADAASGGAF